MRVKVIKEFIDVHTGEYHAIGDVLTVSEERLEEIKKVGQLVEVLQQETAAEPAKPARKRKTAK